ncbi:hypothetical protein [Actinoplanes sp. NPDC049599]|uniref:hypothetical protein n=1 Tax=Actinoplanes sp. NPDC049599 TaxID=3363903 RepID=UPI0037A0AD8A
MPLVLLGHFVSVEPPKRAGQKTVNYDLTHWVAGDQDAQGAGGRAPAAPTEVEAGGRGGVVKYSCSSRRLRSGAGLSAWNGWVTRRVVRGRSWRSSPTPGDSGGLLTGLWRRSTLAIQCRRSLSSSLPADLDELKRSSESFAWLL